jgi:hypothetical protein
MEGNAEEFQNSELSIPYKRFDVSQEVIAASRYYIYLSHPARCRIRDCPGAFILLAKAPAPIRPHLFRQ